MPYLSISAGLPISVAFAFNSPDDTAGQSAIQTPAPAEDPDPRSCSITNYCLGKRMFARAFERSSDAKEIGPRHRESPAALSLLSSASRTSVTSGTACGDRAGLVEYDRINLLQSLQSFAAFDEDPEGGSASGRNHHSSRHSQTHRARAGNHQHRDCGSEGLHDACVRRKDSPCTKRNDRDTQHHRHEDRTDAIGDSLNRSTRSLRLTQQPHNLRQRAAPLRGRSHDTETIPV